MAYNKAKEIKDFRVSKSKDFNIIEIEKMEQNITHKIIEKRNKGIREFTFWFVLGLVLLFSILMLSNFAVAEPSQESNKLFLTPFYRESLIANTNYTYTFNTQFPSGLNSISSGILTIDSWIAPTRTMQVWINGQHCSNANYTISTTFASSGKGVFVFDCANNIVSGNNNVTIRVLGGNVGATTLWIDLTYINNPKGELKVHGTEYIAGDNGKMFLQFLDANDNPVNNSECLLSIWYPNSTIFLNNSIMTYLYDGIYFKNFLVPNNDGVYPSSAKCYKPAQFPNIIEYNVTGDNFESNTFTDGWGWSNCTISNITGCQFGYAWDTDLATIQTNATAGTGGCSQGNYCVRYTGSYGYIERGFYTDSDTRIVNVSYSMKFQNFQTGETMELWIFDGSWYKLKSANLALGYLNNQWYNETVLINSSIYQIDTLLLGFYLSNAPSSNDNIFIDNIIISHIDSNITITNESQYQILRGSGEVHVSKLYDSLSNLTIQGINISNNISNQVWNYPNRNLTYYNNSQINITVNTTNIQFNNITTIVNITNLSTIVNVTTFTLNNITTIVNITNLSTIVNVTTFTLNNVTTIVNITNLSTIVNVTTFTLNNVTTIVNITPNATDLTNYTLIQLNQYNYSGRFDSIDNSLNNITISLSTLVYDIWNYIARYTHGVINN